jgi:hypothetical protein
MNSRQFTDDEIIPFTFLVLLVAGIIIYNYAKGHQEFWSPLTIIAVVFGYYCCLGPYEAVTSGITFDRLLNMRKFYPSAFWGALIALSSYTIGFFFHGENRHRPRLVPVFSPGVLFEYGRKTFLIGFTLFTISTGGNVTKLINPLDAEGVQQVGGSFGNYLSLGVNFLIPAVTILFLHFLVTKRKLWWFIIPFVVCLGIYTTLGFRYRIVLLLGALAFVYYMVKGKRPNPVVLVLGIAGLITFMGIINKSRTYGAGLNVKKLEGLTTEDAYLNGLEESRIFQTSGAIIDIVPKKYPHVGFQPIWSTLVFPIPSKLIFPKNSAQYLFGALDAIYGKKYSKGASLMSYSEYYLAFGWLGIIFGCTITGWFLRRLYNWFKANSNNVLVIAAYGVTIPFLYVVLSRGYLPQVTMLFFFTVFPAYVVLWAAERKYGKNPI